MFFFLRNASSLSAFILRVTPSSSFSSTHSISRTQRKERRRTKTRRKTPKNAEENNFSSLKKLFIFLLFCLFLRTTIGRTKSAFRAEKSIARCDAIAMGKQRCIFASSLLLLARGTRLGKLLLGEHTHREQQQQQTAAKEWVVKEEENSWRISAARCSPPSSSSPGCTNTTRSHARIPCRISTCSNTRSPRDSRKRERL